MRAPRAMDSSELEVDLRRVPQADPLADLGPDKPRGPVSASMVRALASRRP